MSEFRKRRAKVVKEQLVPLAHVLKSWYLEVALEFMATREFRVAEEDLLAEVSDFYLAQIQKLVEERNEHVKEVTENYNNSINNAGSGG